ncbi:HTH domain-containing protein [Granulicatella elegans]|uniref:HTH domain-containing protein n=1 Tax=Granulicatella elegans TaxID=137732 RepID=UPI0028D441FC|nr:HTH domain-containing protein [Granulicatella elegans]
MRKRELVKILEKENFVSLEQLASKLTVSTRTIREDIKTINQESISFNINRSKTRGYYLVIEDMDQYRMTLEYKRQSKNVQKWEFKNVQFYSFNTSFNR